MKILIAYGTTEGHTRKIANHVKNFLGSIGHTSVTFECGSTEESPKVNSFDAIVVAGSVHQEAHQPYLIKFVEENIDALNSKPSAFVSVSLSASLKDGKEAARKYVDDFTNVTDWKPEHVHMAGGAIRFLEYDFFKKLTVQHIVLHGHPMPESTAGNPEYTDWEALDNFLEAFVQTAIEN